MLQRLFLLVFFQVSLGSSWDERVMVAARDLAKKGPVELALLHHPVTLVELERLYSDGRGRVALNTTDKVGRLPLHAAIADFGGSDKLRLLLKLGADPNKRQIRMGDVSDPEIMNYWNKWNKRSWSWRSRKELSVVDLRRSGTALQLAARMDSPPVDDDRRAIARIVQVVELLRSFGASFTPNYDCGPTFYQILKERFPGERFKKVEEAIWWIDLCK